MKSAKKKELEKIWAKVPTDYYFNQNLLQRIWHDKKWSVIRGLTDKIPAQPETPVPESPAIDGVDEWNSSGGFRYGVSDSKIKKPRPSGRGVLTILEIGCAAGHLTKLLSEHYPKTKVTGIDVYKKAILEAKKRFPKLSFLVADAHKLPFQENFFDLVISSETIEHVVDPQKMLNEIARVLKPAGSAIIEMDSGNWLFRLI